MKSKLLLSLLMLAIIIAGAVLLDQELFRVRAVVVHGCETRPAEEVTALSGVEYGQSIFQVELDEVAQNVERSPYYRVDGVARVYPDMIRVTVHERRARAVALNLGSYLIMDEEGYILEIRGDKGYTQCPMVEGLKITTYGVGQQLASSDALQLRAMEYVLGALEEQQMESMVTAIQLHNVLDIRLITIDGYRVMLGDSSNLAKKLAWLQAGLDNLRAESQYGGTIYLSANNASYLPPDAAGQPEDSAEWSDVGGWSFGAAQGQGDESGYGGEQATGTDVESADAPNGQEDEGNADNPP